MASYKLVNYITLRKFAIRNKYASSLLVCDRHFCSKDNETKTDKISSKDSSSKDQEENNNEKSMKMEESSVKATSSEDPIKAAAKQKLMSLLSDIKITSDKPVKTTSSLNLAKPQKRMLKKERLKQMQEAKITPEKEMDMAVKAVASSFKEGSEKVESELTEKLSTLNLSKSEAVLEGDVETDEDVNFENSEFNNEMTENLMSSVEEVADAISESPIPPRSELAKRLMRLSLDQKVATEKKSMSAMIKGMTIESQQPVAPPPPPSPSPRPPSEIEWQKNVKRLAAPLKIGKVNLFSSARLNIFSPDVEAKPDSTNEFWNKLQERELRLMTQFAPANAFEEMIMWTEQGKHWKFPIDNEIDMGPEEKVGFHEHVFLEHHLKGFPTKGPIRHFMELVVVGLSKNPYITVDRKLENIEWFRDYFKEKEDILREEGALG